MLENDTIKAAIEATGSRLPEMLENTGERLKKYDNNDDPEPESLNPVYVPGPYMCSYNHIYYGGESL